MMRAPLIVVCLAIGGVVLAYNMVHGQPLPDPFSAPAPVQAAAPVQVPAQGLAPVQTMAQVTPGAAPAPAPAAPTAAPAAAPPTSRVDETALRYFARQGDTRRVDAEIARLRALYPDWTPPTNLLADDYLPDPAIVAIWELYSNGDYAGARAAIAAKQASDPAFQPSADLLASLDLGEAGLKLRNASDAQQFETVITIAANAPGLLTCESVDNLWRLAEAFLKTGAKQRGVDAYGYILTNCTVPEERLATLQKAMALLDRADLAPLLAMERAGPDGVGEFASIRLDLARSAIAEVLTGKTAKAAPEDVTALETSAKATQSAEDLRLLGWYSLNQKQPSAGRGWFELAMAADPSVLSAHGMAVALLDLRRPGEAEEVIADYRSDSDEMATLYLTAAASLLAQEPRVDLDPDVLGRIVDQTMASRSAAVAQELGWYAYAFTQPQTAMEWFTLSLSWDAQQEPAAYGLLVAADSIKDTATVQRVKAQWGTLSARIANFGAALPQSQVVPTPQPAPAQVQAQLLTVQQVAPVQVAQAQVVQTQAPSSGNGGGSAGGGCSRFVPPESLSPQQALNRAWCLMDLQRPTDAASNFARALQSSSTSVRSDAAYGQSLAYIRLGLAENAAVAASSAPISDDRALELHVAINTRTALEAYEIGEYRRALVALDERARYAPEQNDLLTLRAWSYFHLKRYRESEQIFAAVAGTGYSPAAEGLATVRQVRASLN